MRWPKGPVRVWTNCFQSDSFSGGVSILTPCSLRDSATCDLNKDYEDLEEDENEDDILEKDKITEEIFQKLKNDETEENNG